MLGQIALFKPKGKKLKNRIELVQISVAEARYTLEQRHYLSRCRTGRQINYAVMIDGVCDGVITYAYPFVSQEIANTPSDETLEFARLYLASNIPHSASCAIGKSLRRIKDDWLRDFPDAKEPKLIVSWSDSTRHEGIIYKASNFIYDGKSTGGGWQNRPERLNGQRVMYDDYQHEKKRWIYWLR